MYHTRISQGKAITASAKRRACVDIFHPVYYNDFVHRTPTHRAFSAQEGGAMRYRETSAFRLISFIIALSVFSFLFACSGLRSPDAEKINSRIYAFRAAYSGTYAAAEFAADEELFSSGSQRITRGHHPKGLHQHRNFIFCLCSCLYPLFAVYLLLVLLQRMDSGTFCSLKYIIKYIHDQDGHKSDILRYKVQRKAADSINITEDKKWNELR